MLTRKPSNTHSEAINRHARMYIVNALFGFRVHVDTP
jgi:hypothetical protein